MKHVHSDRLERWLGKESAENVSRYMRSFYWPVALSGVPGKVCVQPGGDFTGELDCGAEASAFDRADDSLRRNLRAMRAAVARHKINAGHGHVARLSKRANAFTNLGALIAAYTGGKGQTLFFQKAGTASTAIAGCVDLFYVGAQPSAGAAGSAAPGGTSPTNATAGALPFTNPANANTSHFISGYVSAGVANNTLLLYDRLFSVAKTASSSGTEAVSGTFSRYQNQTATAEDYIGGNFCFPSVSSAISNTAHNWTVCQYTDQGGNTAQSFPSIAGLASASNTANNIDLAVGNWFMPLAAGDVGVKALTQMQNSSASVTGSINFNIGHPIAFLPCPVANLICMVDGINTMFNMTRIYDNACLAFIEMPKAATTLTNYTGQITLCAE